MKFYMRYIFFFLISLLSFKVFAQTTSENVRANLDVLASGFTQEKIYIHFDKPAYAAGETIWFKAYLMAGTEASTISKTLYVDFFDADGNLMLHGVEPIVEASAKGQFDVPLTFKDNVVHVRAYTRWMLNFDSSFLYNKYIPILNSLLLNKKASVSSAKTSLQFLPEGGSYVTGIKSKIAFKAVDNKGKPAAISGTVINSRGEKIADLISIHDGMGYFYLESAPNEKYMAEWKDENGIAYKTSLPLQENSGVSIEVKLAKDNRGFVIQRSEDASDQFKKLYVIATMQQNLVYMAGVNLSETAVTGGAIPTAALPSGILQITLFDSNWIAIAERITFINNDNYYFEPEVGFAALSTKKRERNVLVISLPDTVASNLSVSITDAGIGVDSSDDIISHLLLTADLKGSIYHPGYYFKNNSDSLQQHLDLVMLTNGWRRINWQNVVNGKTPDIKYTNDTSFLSLAGKIYGLTPQDVRQGVMLMMIIDNPKDTTRLIEQAMPDNAGNFSLPDFIFTDTLRVYYTLAGAGNAANASEVSFDNGMLRASSKLHLNDIFLDNEFSDTAIANRNRWFAREQIRLAKLREGTTLQEVVVKAKEKSAVEKLDERYASGLFSRGDATQFDVLNDPFSKSALNVFSYLQGKVAGLSISQQGSVGSNATVSWRGGTPGFYLNEAPVDVSMLSNMSMNDVAYIKVFRPPFTGSFGGSNGAIAVYTRKGGDATALSNKSIPYKIIIGYSPEKEFYSPDYATFDQRNEQEDLRSTLYWNPMILTTTENHVIKIPFYNNDVTGSFRVIAEGVTKDGRLTHVEKVIE